MSRSGSGPAPHGVKHFLLKCFEVEIIFLIRGVKCGRLHAVCIRGLAVVIELKHGVAILETVERGARRFQLGTDHIRALSILVGIVRREGLIVEEGEDALLTEQDLYDLLLL